MLLLILAFYFRLRGFNLIHLFASAHPVLTLFESNNSDSDPTIIVDLINSFSRINQTTRPICLQILLLSFKLNIIKLYIFVLHLHYFQSY